jgi:hypothetical protein
MKKCKKHPRFKALRRPTAKCVDCHVMWLTKNRGAYRVKLSRLSTDPKNFGPNPLRTEVINGYCNYLPKVGYGFVLLSKPIKKGTSVRLVHTSDIQSFRFKKAREQQFITQNSEYHLEIIRKVKRNPYKLPIPIIITIG